jgi:hypothetical protein
MSEPLDLGALARRLAEIAEQLADEGTAEERAVELAREAAELSAEAGAGIEEALGELGERGAPDGEPGGAG